MGKKTLFLIPNQHMDLVWRRCFDRDLQYGGQNFVSYADLEEIYIKDSIALCEKYPFYHFTLESVAVLSKFLERNPDWEEKIAALIGEKRLYVPFTGNNIVDSNLVMGESLVRNYRQGYHWLKSKFDHVPDGADRNDAFGNSAQMPQIFRKFGVKWAYNVTYSPCSAPYWRGLDGSTVYNIEPNRVGTIGGYPKYRPCPACGGFRDHHCPVCGDRRVDQDHMNNRQFHLALQEDTVRSSRLPCYILSGGEEVAPMEEAALWAMENRDRYDIRFADFEIYKQYCQAEIDRVDDPNPGQLMESPECNCNNTGVYVSRIKVKQAFRELEHAVYASESLAAAAWLAGDGYSWEVFDAIWEKLLFAMFHDAITSTHVDAGYEEVMDAMAEAQRLAESVICRYAPAVQLGADTLWVTNPYGTGGKLWCQAVLPRGYTLEGVAVQKVKETPEGNLLSFRTDTLEPFASQAYRVVPGNPEGEVLFASRTGCMTGDGVLTNSSSQEIRAENTAGDICLENEFYQIFLTNRGIRRIVDKKSGTTVAAAGEYLVGEWLLETDIGSPWATLSLDMRRQPLSMHTRILRHEKSADAESVLFQITPDVRQGFGETCFQLQYRVSLMRGVDQVLFEGDVHWDTWNHRLRIAFPTTIQGNHLYEIPYGTLERKPYAPRIVLPGGDSDWASAAGDYPAIHWAGISGEQHSIALFNRGTPSYQISKDSQGKENIFLSVLRSPTMPTCLHAGADYTMPLFDGMRDSGDHHFSYALKSYTCSLPDSSVHADGIGFNAAMVVSGEKPELSLLPKLRGETCWVTAVTPSLDRKGLIVRVAEYRGKGGTFAMMLPGVVKAVYETDLKEDVIREIPVADRCFTGTITPFEIKTFYLAL